MVAPYVFHEFLTPVSCRSATRVRSLLAALLLSVFAGDVALAQGDTCDDAVLYQWGELSQYAGDLAPLTNDYDPSVPGPSCTGHEAAGKDFVLAMELYCAEDVLIIYRPDGYDGSIYIVTDCSDVSGTCVAGADNSGIGGAELVNVTATGHNTYYIVVDARSAGSGGSFHLEFEYSSMEFPPGACCFPDGHCEFLLMDVCDQSGGDAHPCVPCDPSPCAPSSTLESRWGRIKHTHR